MRDPEVQISVATQPGSAEKDNEDAIALLGGFVVVADGATARTETGCIHGVAWFARYLVAATVQHAELGPRAALAEGIRDTANAHRATCDLDNIGTPSAAVAIASVQAETIEFLALGDVAVVVETINGTDVFVDDRVSKTALPERALADSHPQGSPEKAAALVQMKRAELAVRNKDGGFWVAMSDPQAVDHAITWSVRRAETKRLAILSDGAARLVDPFAILDWTAALDLLASSGPGTVIDRVRAIERADPVAIRWPRNKISDDATAVYAEIFEAQSVDR